MRWILLVFVLFLLGCTEPAKQVVTEIYPEDTSERAKLDEELKCREDSDCVIISKKNSCRNGVININYAKPEEIKNSQEYNDSQSKSNEIVVECATMTVSRNPRCENGKCVADSFSY